jgi:L-threonylcarbamoyladenylate synthase
VIVEPTSEQLDRAAAALRRGALVAFPTETVYGLGADARNPEAVRRIFAAKGRPSDHPVIVHLAKAGDLAAWARHVPAGAEALAMAFWPGPLTLILPRAEGVSDTVTGSQDSVGLRVPAHPVARELLARFAAMGGEGVAAPSANRFGRISATTAAHVAEEFADEVELILDGGPCDHGIESTIVGFTTEQGVLLRPGAVALQDLTRVLGYSPHPPTGRAPRASGTLASHYAPHTPSQLLSSGDLMAAVRTLGDRSKTIAILAHSLPRPAGFAGVWLKAPAGAAGYAHALYANLRQLDLSGAEKIWIETPPAGDAWAAVTDRVRRATHGQ